MTIVHFKLFILSLVTLFELMCGPVHSANDFTFIHKPALYDRVCLLDDQNFLIQAVSKINCGQICSQNESCISFSFSPSTLECTGCVNILRVSSASRVSPSPAVYYYNEGSVTTTSSTSTTSVLQTTPSTTTTITTPTVSMTSTTTSGTAGSSPTATSPAWTTSQASTTSSSQSTGTNPASTTASISTTGTTSTSTGSATTTALSPSASITSTGTSSTSSYQLTAAISTQALTTRTTSTTGAPSTTTSSTSTTGAPSTTTGTTSTTGAPSTTTSTTSTTGAPSTTTSTTSTTGAPSTTTSTTSTTGAPSTTTITSLAPPTSTQSSTSTTNQDINECSTNSGKGPCEDMCTNIEGGFVCSCNNGRQLSSDNVSCESCNITDTWGPACENQCSCGAGTMYCDSLNGCVCETGWNGTLCDTDMDECADYPCGPNANCTNIPGNYTCQCISGYTFGNGVCVPCNITDTWGPACENQCSCGAGTMYCDSLTGCVCETGWNGTLCDTDVDECADYPCGPNANCTNTPGNYTCQCISGYTFGNGVCVPCNITDTWGPACENQCSCGAGTMYCDSLTGCVCETGWNGTLCDTDVDECADYPCGPNANCTNTPGNYTCQCISGYTFGNGVCVPCNITDTWGPACENQCSCGAGTMYCDSLTGCVCETGWNGTLCDTDVDECADYPCGPNANCTNTPGKYTCQCISGYTFGNGVCVLECLLLNDTSPVNASDCYDIKLNYNATTSGVYNVTLSSGRTISVYCDLESLGGGWTVLQYRYEGSVDFYRTFNEYVCGFGDVFGEFWLGLQNIHEMAPPEIHSQVSLYMEDKNGLSNIDQASVFSVGPLPCGEVTLQSGDSALTFTDGACFSAKDFGPVYGCSWQRQSGWWHTVCTKVNPNGYYDIPGSIDSSFAGMTHTPWRYEESLKVSKIMFRRFP